MGEDTRASLSAKNQYGSTPAHYAAEWGQVKILECLHELGENTRASLLAKNQHGSTPAHYAAEWGQVKILECLHELGENTRASLLAKAQNGWTPAHVAAVKGQVKILKCLHELGGHVRASLSAKNQHGSTPSYSAAYKGQEESVLILALLGEDIDMSAFCFKIFKAFKKKNSEIKSEIMKISWLSKLLLSKKIYLYDLFVKFKSLNALRMSSKENKGLVEDYWFNTQYEESKKDLSESDKKKPNVEKTNYFSILPSNLQREILKHMSVETSAIKNLRWSHIEAFLTSCLGQFINVKIEMSDIVKAFALNWSSERNSSLKKCNQDQFSVLQVLLKKDAQLFGKIDWISILNVKSAKQIFEAFQEQLEQEKSARLAAEQRAKALQTQLITEKRDEEHPGAINRSQRLKK